MTLNKLLSALSLPDGIEIPPHSITVRELADLLDSTEQGSETVHLKCNVDVEVGEPSFAARLRFLRTQKGLTQQQLADASGLHLQTI